MKMKNGEITTPTILIKFIEDVCEWHSVGWDHISELREKAVRAINQASEQHEVVEYLVDAGFDVIVQIGNGVQGAE